MGNVQDEMLSESARINYGKYSVPPTLQSLLKVAQEVADSEAFYSAFNMYVSLNDFRYFNTPCDVVVFGTNGVDGIHFGFLTDYGRVFDLEEAPIVCVSPMDFDRPVRLVADNIRAFLAMQPEDGGLTINVFQNEEHYLTAKREWEEEQSRSPYQPTEAEQRQTEAIRRQIAEQIALPPIAHPYQYIQKVNRSREQQITVHSQDGIGVLEPLLEHEKQQVSLMHIHKDVDLNLEQLQAYLALAPRAAQLALFRDIQIHHILSRSGELQAIVINQLQALGLNDEADRIAYS
ncbi:hypothetical protein [Paenibacillus sp. GCM10027626]|uniref:hypothetical protein n=1 Tax=Paenibacillus sp. GCM10027626 TaxID=3273411 RepID=UPI0036263A03